MFTTEKDSNLCIPFGPSIRTIFRQVEATPGWGLPSHHGRLRFASLDQAISTTHFPSWSLGHTPIPLARMGKNSENPLKKWPQMPHKISPKSCIMTKNSTDVLGFSSSFSRSCLENPLPSPTEIWQVWSGANCYNPPLSRVQQVVLCHHLCEARKYLRLVRGGGLWHQQ